jgi:BASS family bile acid:Na+ symporter
MKLRVRDPTARKILAHPAVFFGAGLVVALIIPGPAKPLEPYILSPLIIVMFLSTTEIKFKALLNIKRYGLKVVTCLLLNYGLVSAVALGLAWLVFREGDFFMGFVMVAAMPTAIAVIPLSYIMKGDTEVAVVGVSLCYLLALIIGPGLVYIVIGSSLDVWEIFEALLFVIVLPLLASRLLMALDIDKKLGLGKKVFMNINFFMVMYIIIGVNFENFFIEGWVLVLVILVCVARSFGTGAACLATSKIMKCKRADAINYTFFGSFKNLGLTATLALVLFGEKASIPAALGAPVEMISYIALALLIGVLFPERSKKRMERRKEKGRDVTVK